MEWLPLLYEILTVCVIPLLGVLTAYVVKYLKSKANEINDKMEWECPQCHNKDQDKMNVTRRTCGYLGENFWNVGKTKEIKARVLHC